ncbi:hypothetical protein OWR29_33435 [Actinoplanes sp. Pm04-4]|uniref:Uncharacterized protein n=1 Tax=Paractinoplanes pyxinae TaxID=2997416 RepID=A0ABT4B8U2_9ACTN|nr:hypothetical protein [Actinoplanes pyxinae]MCY1142923.1 hypothetical protein [Actinoplanes pyxinae]
MRHFRSILYALVLAPAVWVLAGVGFTHDLTARGRGDFAVESVAGLLLLVLAGAAYAILLFAPISPAGPLLGGLAFLGISAWALAAPEAYAGIWPQAVAKDGFDISRPGYGLAALLALPLICTALSARRWARYEPPVLPLIGQLGRARGHVAMPPAVPAQPISNDTTVVVPGPSIDPDATTVLPSEEPTAGTPVVGEAVSGTAAERDPADEETAGTAPATPVESAPDSAGKSVPLDEDEKTVESTPVATAPADDTAASDEGRAVVAALAAEEPFKIGEVVDVAPEDEATIALLTVREERQTAVVVSWDEAATVAALSNGQASTRFATVTPPPAEPEILNPTDAEAGDKLGVGIAVAPEPSESPTADTRDNDSSSAVAGVAPESADSQVIDDAALSIEADHQARSETEERDRTAGLATEPAETLGHVEASASELATADSDAQNKLASEPVGEAPSAVEESDAAVALATAAVEKDGVVEATHDEVGDPATESNSASQAANPSQPAAEQEEATTEFTLEQTVASDADVDGAKQHGETNDHRRSEAEPEDATVDLAAEPVETAGKAEAAEVSAPENASPSEDEPADEEPADGGLPDDEFADLFVVGRAKPAPNTRAVPPELEETRSLDAPDPDRTRAIHIGELTTKLQVTPADGQEPGTVNEPVRARATAAAPDVSGPDLSEVEVTRSLSAPDPDRTHTIELRTERRLVGEKTTRSLSAPDPDRTQAITVVSSDDEEETTRSLTAPDPDRTHAITIVSSDDVETTRSFDAPDPDRTQPIAVVDGNGTQALNEADPERTHLVRVAELAAPLHVVAPEPPADMAVHPGRAAGQNTAALSHTGDIGGDETQVIRFDPERTQVVRPGTVEPPGERTEIVRLPAKGKATVPGREDEPQIPAQRRPS